MEHALPANCMQAACISCIVLSYLAGRQARIPDHFPTVIVDVPVNGVGGELGIEIGWCRLVRACNSGHPCCSAVKLQRMCRHPRQGLAAPQAYLHLPRPFVTLRLQNAEPVGFAMLKTIDPGTEFTLRRNGEVKYLSLQDAETI